MNVYGEIIKATAFGAPDCDRAPNLAADNSGMSGSDGTQHTHSGELDAMWLTARDPADNTITFDLGTSRQLGYMFVWNFNQEEFTGAGLRDVKLFYSADCENWKELKGEGYPYGFARASGLPGQPATNLDDGKNSPVDFGGVSARYVKIVPDSRQNIGNWGEYVEHQNRFGLSQVRFFAYKPLINVDSFIPSLAMVPDNHVNECNITNSLGLSDVCSHDAVHGTDPKTMWLSELQSVNQSIIFDLDGTYPISEMWVWNYNEKNNFRAGLKKVRIFHSIDRCDWTELKSDGYPYTFALAKGCDNQPATNLDDGKNSPVKFGDVMARFVKIEPAAGMGKGTWGAHNLYENRFGLSKVRFYAGEGYCTEPDRHMSGKLSQYNGWSGADGIFMAPLDGVEGKKPVGEPISDTAVIFSDSFIGVSNPVTRRRKNYRIVNNTAAHLSDKAGDLTLDLIYNTDENGIPISMITDEHLMLNSLEFYKGYFYWLQDCVITNDKLYSFTDNVMEDPSGDEGFQFKLVGVDRVSFDVKAYGVDFKNPTIVHTPLFRDMSLFFGCCILPNSFEAGLPGADGYIYIYGLHERCKGYKELVVSRVKPEDFEDFSAFEFFDGQRFQSDMSKVAAICDEGSSEMSITPIEDGEYKGKYLFVYTISSVGDTIACRIGETPCGPFGPPIPLYFMDTPKALSKIGGRRTYTYNAKAHYHVSRPGELLISYNVNTTDFESHITNCDIYRPRFLKLRRLTKS